MISKIKNNFWTALLLVTSIYLLIQMFYSWSVPVEGFVETAETLPEEHSVFITMEESLIGANKRGFDSLMDSLVAWEYDKKSDQIKIKYESSLPTSSTKAMIFYNKGFKSFEKHDEILSINNFPYQYFFNQEPLFRLNFVDSEGTAFLEFKGNKLKLKENQSRVFHWFEDFQIHQIKIKNNGVYNKNQFAKMD